MAAARKAGKKHTILFYKHSMDRVWRSLLLLSLFLVPVWYFAPGLLGIQQGTLADSALLGAMIVSLVGAVFTFFVRNMAYIQVKSDHVLIATPFLKLKVSFRRMRSIRTMELSQMYDIRRLGWADKRFLRPYFGKTVLTIVVKDYPLGMGTMKLFLPKFMFNPMDKGFVLLVKDWMTLSTEFDTLIGSFREGLRDKPRRQESMRGLYG
jgi:hypothetical protein